MAYNERIKDYSIKYAKEKLKRVPLDLRKEQYEQVLQAASAVGESVNGYIKRAIQERIARENDLNTTAPEL